MSATIEVFLCGHYETADTSTRFPGNPLTMYIFTKGACSAPECQNTDLTWFEEQTSTWYDDDDLKTIEFQGRKISGFLHDLRLALAVFHNHKHQQVPPSFQTFVDRIPGLRKVVSLADQNDREDLICEMLPELRETSRLLDFMQCFGETGAYRVFFDICLELVGVYFERVECRIKSAKNIMNAILRCHRCTDDCPDMNKFFRSNSIDEGDRQLGQQMVAILRQHEIGREILRLPVSEDAINQGFDMCETLRIREELNAAAAIAGMMKLRKGEIIHREGAAAQSHAQASEPESFDAMLDRVAAEFDQELMLKQETMPAPSLKRRRSSVSSIDADKQSTKPPKKKAKTDDTTDCTESRNPKPNGAFSLAGTSTPNSPAEFGTMAKPAWANGCVLRLDGVFCNLINEQGKAGGPYKNLHFNHFNANAIKYEKK